MNALKRYIGKVRSFLATHPRTGYAIVAVGVVIFAICSYWAVLALSPKPKLDTTPIAVTKPVPKPVYYSELTGEKVKNAAAITKPVTAIMIENSPEARPQSGLKDAEVVYEAIAEGGITRFMALYQQHKPQLIGPVRSVRMYYLDWEIPYNASIAHVGGSSEALKVVRNGSYRDLDQFFNAETCWRSSDRYAPHNVYTSFKKLDALNKAKKYTKSHPKGFSRTNEKPAKTPTANTITVNISGPLFESTYHYDKKHNRYIRYQAGAQHLDREKGVITPKVVVVMNVNMSTVFQDTYRGVIKTTGSGKAIIFQNGTAKKVTWHRDTKSDQYNFIDANGKDVSLVRGQTWITAIPNGSSSVSWKK